VFVLEITQSSRVRKNVSRGGGLVRCCAARMLIAIQSARLADTDVQTQRN
jgi:hypothetical protein